MESRGEELWAKKKAKTGKTCHGVSAKSLNTWAKQVCALIYTFWVIPRLQGGGTLQGLEKKNSKDLGCLLRVSISNCIKVHKTIMHFTVIKDVWPYTVSTSCDYYSHFMIMQKECKGANIILWFISFILRCRQGAEEWHVLLRDAIYCRVKTLNLD